MKILLVNNNTLHLQEIAQALAGHHLEVQHYHPGIDFHTAGKDLIILSGGGGEGKELHDYHTPRRLWYEDEMQLVLNLDKPIIGICMGFEIIAAAHGSKATAMPKGIENFAGLQSTSRGHKQLGVKNLWQFEAHDWRIQEVSAKHFDVLAHSHTGIEVIRHKTRPIIATQFHPETPGGTLKLAELL